ncbi:MAG: HutP family protein [Acidaminococcaceae bacterium]
MENIKDFTKGIGSATMLLAMTNTLTNEKDVVNFLLKDGYRCAVVAMGEKLPHAEFKEKIINVIINTALNDNVISKEPYEVHAMIHAALEAKECFLMNVSTSAYITVKIALLRKTCWVAVGIFGEEVVYKIASTERAGLGIMHI